MVCVHHNDTADAFAFSLGSVVYIAAAFEGTGVYAEEGELPYVWVGHNLECESREWFAVARMTFCFFTIWQGAFDGRNINWGWAVVYDCVEKELYTLVLEGGTAEHWNSVVCDGSLANGFLDVFDIEVASFEEFFHQFFVEFCNVFDEFLTVFVNGILEIFWNWDLFIVDEVGTFEELVSLHGYKVN